MKDLPHIIEDVKKQVIEYVLNYDKTCNGNYGVHFYTLRLDLALEEPVLKDALNGLFKARLINVRDHHSGKIVFLNYENPEIQNYEKA